MMELDTLDIVLGYLPIRDVRNVFTTSLSLMYDYSEGKTERAVIERHWKSKFSTPCPFFLKSFPLYFHILECYEEFCDEYGKSTPLIYILHAVDTSGLQKMLQVHELYDEMFCAQSLNVTVMYRNGYEIDFKSIHCDGEIEIFASSHGKFIYFCSGISENLSIIQTYEGDDILRSFNKVIVMEFPELVDTCTCCECCLDSE